MLDYGIRINNTSFMTELEKSFLWRKVTEICTDSKSYSGPSNSIEKVLIYFLNDWAGSYQSDHFSRTSIFTKLMTKVKELAPEKFKEELNSVVSTPTPPPTFIMPQPVSSEPAKQVLVTARKDDSPRAYYTSLFKVIKINIEYIGDRVQPEALLII